MKCAYCGLPVTHTYLLRVISSIRSMAWHIHCYRKVQSLDIIEETKPPKVETWIPYNG